MRGSRRNYFSVSLCAAAALALVLAQAACASAIVLRPDADKASTGWAVVGAPTAWQALDDNVVETETPSGVDYITSSATTGYRRVDMSTANIAGAAIANPTVWWYTPTSATTEVQVYGTGGGPIAKGTAGGIGWHSLSLKLDGTQSQLNALYLDFRPSGAAATRSVSAAFIRLTVEPRVYWGAWIDGDVYTEEGKEPWGDAPWDSATWSTFTKHAGKSPSIIHFGQPPPWVQKTFASTPFTLAEAGGAIPLVDMASDADWFPTHVTLKDIAEGHQDAQLRTWAVEVAKFGRPFFFRWNWEMNGTWFPWGKQAVENPADYIAAWQRFHNIAEEKGATNITWVWCPNVAKGAGGETSITAYYPGSSYVDWTCIDGYNFGTNPIKPGGWTSFVNLFQSTYNTLVSNYPSKPIMIGEVGATESGGSKAGWISDAFETQLPLNFPKIKAINWFNWNVEEGEGRWDWPIESSATAEAAFLKGISLPYYSTNSFGGLPALTRIQPLP